MLKKMTLLLVVAALMLTGLTVVTAQDDDIPTVAIIRFGPLRPFELAEKGTLDLFAAYGYVDGENINYIFGDAEFDFPTANLIIEDVLNQDPDIIIAITTPILQAAYNAAQDLDNPPIILFNTVTSPYAAGVAQASCIKPDFVTGSQALAPYENIVPLLLELDPEIETVGYLYNNAEANSVASTEIVSAVAEDLGLTLEIAPVTNTAEVGTAAEALASRGVDAFFIPTDSTVSDGLPALLTVAEEIGVPVMHADSSQVYAGVTAAAGLDYYQEGIDTAAMAIAYLNGDIDIATTGISRQQGTALAINLDTAELQGVTIPESMLEQAAYVITGGESTETDPVLPEMSFEDRQAMDMAFVESLFCSEERIAEQQAELDAAESE